MHGCLGVIWNNFVSIFRFEISSEALLINVDICVAVKHFPSREFIVVDVFDFTSNWNLDFEHPVVFCNQ